MILIIVSLKIAFSLAAMPLPIGIPDQRPIQNLQPLHPAALRGIFPSSLSENMIIDY